MFDLFRNNRRIVQVLLALLLVPFALFGVERYFNASGAGEDIAKVGKRKITTPQFREALREQQERMRIAARGQTLPQSMLDSPELRRNVLDTLINRELLMDYARRSNFVISDEMLAQFIASVPALQVDGKFSPERYDALVAAQNMTKQAFEARVRQDLILQQAGSGLMASSIVGKTTARHWLDALLEEREVASFEFKPDQYLSKVTLAADAAQKYYDAHRSDFELPAQVRAEYVVLSQASLLGQVNVSDEDIKAFYDSHPDRYRQAEERRASHILIEADKSSSPEKLAQAKQKAEALLAQVRKNPKDFARIAKENSQDKGSAAKGGDLDWFSRGAMVKPFEDAVFQLKEGQISDVVQSDYGFHVIMLTGIRPEKVKPLADVRGDIENELKLQAAAKQYAEAAENFTNMVYEQPDSLKPAADKFKLTLQQSDWIAKGVAGSGLASNPKVVAALFTDDAIKNRRNTEAIEVAPNTLVAARVIDYKPATTLPFAEAKATIEKRLTLDEAKKLAAQDGEAKLAALKQNQSVNTHWSAPRRITRLDAQGITRAGIDAIFKAPATSLPAFTGAATADGGYAIYLISEITPFNGDDKNPKAQALRERYQQLVANEEFAAWIAMLRDKAGVEVNEKALQAKE